MLLHSETILYPFFFLKNKLRKISQQSQSNFCTSARRTPLTSNVCKMAIMHNKAARSPLIQCHVSEPLPPFLFFTSPQLTRVAGLQPCGRLPFVQTLLLRCCGGPPPTPASQPPHPDPDLSYPARACVCVCVCMWRRCQWRLLPHIAERRR